MGNEESREVVVRLNQQQLELVDQAAVWIGSEGRADTIVQALEEFHAERFL